MVNPGFGQAVVKRQRGAGKPPHPLISHVQWQQRAEFNRDSDIRGPIAVSAALERDVGNTKQRVVVIGTGKGLSNEYVGLLGNMDLGINIMNWLAGDDSLITIQPKSRIDLTLELSRGELAAIGFGFLIFLPIGLLLAGGMIWWRRRKS